MSQHRRQIRNFLLDRKLQVRYSLAVVITSALLSSGLGYFWYDEMRTTSRVVEVQAIATAMTDADVSKIRAELDHNDHRRLAVLITFGLALSLILGAFGIVFTHKIAGPLFKVQRHLRDIGAGRLHEIQDLRKGDQLGELWSDLRQMHRSLRQRATNEVLLYERLLVALNDDSLAPGTEVVDEIVRLKEAKAASLKDSVDTKCDT